MPHPPINKIYIPQPKNELNLLQQRVFLLYFSILFLLIILLILVAQGGDELSLDATEAKKCFKCGIAIPIIILAS